jgi:hypothetical protein
MRMMQNRRNLETIGRSCRRALAVALLAGLWACVGSETGERTSNRGNDQDADRSRPLERARAGAVYVDTVASIDYQLFEAEPDDEEGKRVTYRLMALESGTQESMTKTVRLALDSLQRADTSLVAVRAVLYVFRPTARMEGKLIPVVWGEWIPPGGWDAAVASERNRIHRSYVYAVNPGWNRQAAVEEE